MKRGVSQQPLNGAIRRNSGFRIAALNSARDAGLRLIVQEGPATAVDGRAHCVKGGMRISARSRLFPTMLRSPAGTSGRVRGRRGLGVCLSGRGISGRGLRGMCGGPLTLR